MTADSAWAGPEPAELIDRLARRFVDEYGMAARSEIVRVIEMLIDNGNLEMARLWTLIMHATSRILHGQGPHSRPH